jgi:hypothetical protein
MRRTLLIAGAALALSLTSAGAAMAHGHVATRHTSRHHRHRQHAHIVNFVPSHHTTSPSSTPPGTTPPATEEVATVVSFANGVLTLKLSDGSTVSGKVTEDTRIECPPPAGEQGEGSDDQGEGDDNHGAPGPFGFGGHGQGDDMSGPPQGETGDDDGGEHGEGHCPPSCGTSALVEGAKVAEAELRVEAGGASWEKIELLG